ncbi:MAG: hybrid sensor histidine kinase/response regulator [Bacteriovoracaceae bacterium]|nr:hybrid sensor histidine kinase/response regulator [Bacteriovoracaceae bacterium]
MLITKYKETLQVDKKVETMNVRDIVEDTISLLKSPYEQAGISLDHQIGKKGCYIDGNTGHFQQILMDLFQISKDLLEDSACKQIVIQEFMNSKNEVVVTINDTGSGMTTEELQPGIGMRMNIINSLVQEMSGKLEIESQVNKGISITLTFPASEEVQPSKNSISSELLTRKVLIVDDEEEIRAILKDSLEELGLEVEEACDGNEALELLKITNYDLVCTDMAMPKLSGDEFIELARKLPNGNIPYILITGGMTSKAQEQKIDLNTIAEGVLVKPFDHDTFCELVTDKLQK